MLDATQPSGWIALLSDGSRYCKDGEAHYMGDTSILQRRGTDSEELRVGGVVEMGETGA